MQKFEQIGLNINLPILRLRYADDTPFILKEENVYQPTLSTRWDIYTFSFCDDTAPDRILHFYSIALDKHPNSNQQGCTNTNPV